MKKVNDRWPCPVCQEFQIEVDSDWEGYESADECLNCRFYSSGHSYGIYEERFPFQEFQWAYTETHQKRRVRESERGRVIGESRFMWGNPDTRPFLLKIREDWADPAPPLVFADYLEERGLCPLTVAAIRDRWKEQH